MALRSVWSAALLGATLLGGGVAQASDPPPTCAPSARLEGERALIAPIRASLQARGVAESGALACQRLEVRVMPASPGYDLFLTDADGRTDRRQIARPETAAMVIESWLQADLSDPLLDRGSPATAEARSTPAALSASAALSAVAPATATDGRALGSLRGESAVDRGSAVWWGAAAGACLRMGPLCTGPQVRFRASEGPPGLSPSGRALADLRSFEGGLGLEAPVSVGPMRLVPGLFLGAGRLSGRWHQEALQVPRDRTRDRPLDRGPYRNPSRNNGRDGDGRDVDGRDQPADESFARVGLRAGAGLGLALPLGAGVAMELQLTVGVRPVAPDDVSGSSNRTTFGLTGHAGAGLGLRYGAL
jgi:hypothetical protein